MHHVIVGAGPAGVVAAEHLRKLDPTSDITLIGDEPEAPYSRMAIPYYLIDKIGESGTHLRKSDGHYDTKRVEVVQDRVAGIDASARKVNLAGGGDKSYDRLLIATGSRPVSPPIPGLDLPGVHNCWTLADARHIVDLAKPNSKVVLMGAGFIGCIILEALASRGVDLTVVEMENRMVPRMMDEASGGLIKSWCENKGVTVLTSTKVSGIEKGSDTALSIALENGSTLPADLLISATGVTPCTDFLDGSGVEVEHGIMVNHHLQTNVDGIYAAGDVAQGRDFSTGGYSVQAIQPTAVEHGRIAATNMVDGSEIVHAGSVNMNVLDTMGLISGSFGLWEGVDGGDSAELSDHARYRYIRLNFQDDVLVGANSLGVTQHIGVLRGLIQSKLHLGDWKAKLMDDPTQVMSAYLAATQGMGATTKVQ
ncbi:MAG: FAD-dependent oxidoreductase [Pseudomonadota bacterium]